MISPSGLRPPPPPPAERAPREHNEAIPGFVPGSPAAGPGNRKEKDSGSAFGPESVPLATGLVPVVYWVPGPFPGPTPRPAGCARQAFLPVLVSRLAQGRLAAGAPAMA